MVTALFWTYTILDIHSHAKHSTSRSTEVIITTERFHLLIINKVIYLLIEAKTQNSSSNMFACN